MPLYEYYCPPCGTRFELLRPARQMDEAAVCPSGHITNNRVLSLFAVSRSGAGSIATMDTRPAAGGDSCCSPGAGGCSCC